MKCSSEGTIGHITSIDMSNDVREEQRKQTSAVTHSSQRNWQFTVTFVLVSKRMPNNDEIMASLMMAL